MPSYEDPMDAAVRRPTIGGLGGAYNQTDVMHDPNYLIAQSRNPNRRVSQSAVLALHDLYRQDALAQRNQALQQRMDFRDAALQQNDIHFQANQRRMMAHEAAQESYHQLSTDRETEIDEQGHGLLQTMGYLDSALRRGEISKDQYDEGLLQAGQQFPLGTRHPEAARHYEFAITEADKQNAFNARRELTQVAKIGAKYGIDPQFDPDTGRPSIELTQQAALQTPKGKNEALGQMNHEMAAKYGVATGVGSLFNPIAPHVGTDAEGNQIENPTHVALPYADPKTGKVAALPVPVPLFNQMKADFNDRYFALNPPSAAQPAGAAPTPNNAPAAATVKMQSPTGMVQDVPQELADHYTKLGATPVQEPQPDQTPIAQ